MPIVPSLPFDLTNGQTADANQVMANFNDIVSGVNANAANAPVNTNITQLAGLTTPIPPALGGSSVYVGGPTVGSANAQQVSSLSPGAFALNTGNVIAISVGAGLTNTGALTLNLNGTGYVAVYKRTAGGLVALQPGDWRPGFQYILQYDGTQYELLSSIDRNGAIGSLASATQTIVAALPNQAIEITGTTAIAGLDAASPGPYTGIAGDIRFLTFAASLTLTYNATSLILPGNANIVTSAGDAAIALCLGSGNWQIISYTYASNANRQAALGLGALAFLGAGTGVGLTTISSFTGSISGFTLTSGTQTPSASIAIGQYLYGSGVVPGTVITGGSGNTWTVNIGQTVGSTAMTTANGLLNAIALSLNLANSGHITLPGGLIINWGQITITSSTSGSATFDKAFTTQALAGLVSSTGGQIAYVASLSATAIVGAIVSSASTTLQYIAIGY
jgi:hypothetical protein